MPKRGRVPGCTHIVVTRSYILHEQCHLCSLASPMGFLYECQQECDRTTLQELVAQHNGKSIIRKSELRQQLECGGLSESVIETAELGHYTDSQLELLKVQKAGLRQSIQDFLECSQICSPVAKWTAMLPGPSNNDGTISSKISSDKNSLICGLKACHRCRPYFVDRIPISIQGVLQGDFYPMTRADIASLPVKSSRIVRTIGLHQPTRPRCASKSMPLSMSTSTTPTGGSVPATASTPCSDANDMRVLTTQSNPDGLSVSSEGRVRQSGARRGWRATAQRWIRSHRLSKSVDFTNERDIHAIPYDFRHGAPQDPQELVAAVRMDETDSKRSITRRQDSQMSPGSFSARIQKTSATKSEPESLFSDEFSVFTTIS